MAEEPSDTSHLDPASRRIGTVLDGKWTLDRLLGVGGMAAVYAGTHRNGARAAIKLFPFSVTTSAESAERILREGYLANKIGHPAVVRVLDDHLDREREYAYLVMELLEGETARQRVERTGPMSPLEAAGFMIELTSSLAAAHEKGVVHRDIKPENLFLTTDGHLKVLDFGVARALDGTSSSVTRTGATLGTPAYMSPEQARGRPSEISTRSDLYSTGATLLFLIAGEFLHQGESAQEIMVRAAWTPAPKIHDRGLGIPVVIADIIDRACAFEPADRYQSATESGLALEAARALLSADPTAARPVLRVEKGPEGATSTEPLPLSRPSRPTDETIMDHLGMPSSGAATTLSTRQSQRTTWWVGAVLTTLVAALVVILWPHGSDHDEGQILGAHHDAVVGDQRKAGPGSSGAEVTTRVASGAGLPAILPMEPPVAPPTAATALPVPPTAAPVTTAQESGPGANAAAPARSGSRRASKPGPSSVTRPGASPKPPVAPNPATESPSAAHATPIAGTKHPAAGRDVGY